MTAPESDRDFHQFRQFDRPLGGNPAADAALKHLLMVAANAAGQAGDRASPTSDAHSVRTAQGEVHMAGTSAPYPGADGAVTDRASRTTTVRRSLSQAQPLASFGLVLLLLVGLVAISFDRLTDRSTDPGSDPSRSASLVSQQGTPDTATTCQPRTATWDPTTPDLAPDRPSRYTAVERAPDQIGALALETYLAFMSCASVEMTGTVIPDDQGDIDVAMATYRTASRCPGDADLGAFGCLLTPSDPLGAEFLATAPITLNTPPQEYRIPGTAAVVPTFDPADVYRLFDGRYGVVIGSPSTAIFRDGATDDERILGSPVVFFAAFREQDGQLFIDEHAYVFILDAEPNATGSVPSAATPATD